LSNRCISTLICRAVSLLGCLVVAVSCDRDSGDVPAAVPDQAGPTASVPARATIETLAPLWPNQPTQLAVGRGDSSGIIFFNQPTKEGRDVVMQYGARNLPETTALNAANIAAALGERDGRGNITALCAGGDGKVYFLFRGTGGKQSKFALGQYDARTAEVRVLADTTSLLRDSKLGASIELATPTLVGTDSFVWLLLATLDQTVLLRFEPGKMPARGLIQLVRPFDRAAAGDEVLQLGRAECRLSAGPGDTLLLTDSHAAGLFQIDSAGRATLISTLVALPNKLSTAVALSAERAVIVAGEAEEIRPTVDSRVEAAKVTTNYPAVLIFERSGKIIPIAKERLSGRPGLAVYALRITATARENDSAFIAYDAGSGELLRVRLAE